MGGGTHVLVLYPDGPWTDNYQPTKMRISFTGAASVDLTYDTWDFMGPPESEQVNSYTSGQEISLTWISPDAVFTQFQFVNNSDNSFEVTAIEFLVEPVECANHNSASAALDDPEITDADLYDTQTVHVDPGKYAAIEYANGMGFYTDVLGENQTSNTDFDIYTFDSSKSQVDYSNGTGQGGEHEANLDVPYSSPCYIVIHNKSGTECCTISVGVSMAT
jgi:hypothetical protein